MRQLPQYIRIWTFAVVFFGLALNQTAHALNIKDIDKRGVLKIGVKNNLPLMGFTQADGSLAGFEIELSRKLVRTIWGDRVQVEFIPLKNRDRLPALLSQQVDIAIANLRITDSRRRVVHFSQPYLRSSTQLIGLATDGGLFQNICQSRIGVLQGSIAIGRMMSRCPDTQYTGFSSYASAFSNLESGSIDFFAGDAIALRGSKSPQMKLSTESIGLSSVAIAMPKGLQYRSLHEAIDLALLTLEENGELQQMRNIWRLSAK